ncbi:MULTISPECIES: flagellar biosynthesis repressor FlbT [unclassified Methylobacterium]|uniref:flagellar biosynthesis repressor FlbT n=1 Tax=unclassified Methylobacterium TaxID=2615210 RepID=UPI0006F8E8C5|nr:MULTISPECIES: flagellar biosynthesis repressor FlbT [unclassified Methylobacterium]KQO59129.1 flagellar protein FlbT [Methylobacterium sp. Leaf86]KQO85349.1 flagellar protein FlbT [Methylobacterium sp. Leaf91]MBO1021337.1 flagellar biosynthesis repressor FlbT [Methylobacterium sp. SD274]
MALRLDLKPYEGFLINGALIRNGSRRSDFLIETHCKFLRESEVIKESEADTPAKMLCVTLQILYLADDPAEAEDLFARQATEIMRTSPSLAPHLLAIHDAIADRRHHGAIKLGRALVVAERSLSEAA